MNCKLPAPVTLPCPRTRCPWTWWTAGRFPSPWAGIRASRTVQPRSARAGVSSPRAKAFTGPNWMKTSAWRTCSRAGRPGRAKRRFNAGWPVGQRGRGKLHDPSWIGNCVMPDSCSSRYGEVMAVTKTNWKRLLKGIEVDTQAYGSKLRPVAPKHLDAYEKRIGLKLPRSYRSFCEVFGPGEFAEQFKVAVPGYRGSAKAFSVEDLDSCARDGDEFKIYSKNPEQHARGIYFCIDLAGTSHFFDPAEVTDARNHEYAVWTVSRYYDRLRRRADKFWQFVTEFYLGPKHRQLILGPTTKPLFMPVGL